MYVDVVRMLWCLCGGRKVIGGIASYSVYSEGLNSDHQVWTASTVT